MIYLITLQTEQYVSDSYSLRNVLEGISQGAVEGEVSIAPQQEPADAYEEPDFQQPQSPPKELLVRPHHDGMGYGLFFGESIRRFYRHGDDLVSLLGWIAENAPTELTLGQPMREDEYERYFC